MLPTALPYHTPAKLSRAFFVRRHTTGQQRQGSNPTPRPPQGGSALGGRQQGARQFIGIQKTAPQALTTTVGCDTVRVHRRGRHARASALQRGPTRKGWPSFFSPRQGAQCSARTGLAGLSRRKGWGAPCCQAAARTPRPAGLPLPTPRGWAPRRSVRFAHSTNVARGSAPGAALFPDRRPRAAAGRAPAVAQPGSLCKAFRRLRRWLSPALQSPSACAGPLRRCSVATGPRMMVGRLSPSACGTRAGHHAPGTGALRSAPPGPRWPERGQPEPGRGPSAGCGASLSRRSLPPCPPCTAVCASAHAARRAVVCPRASQPPDAPKRGV